MGKGGTRFVGDAVGVRVKAKGYTLKDMKKVRCVCAVAGWCRRASWGRLDASIGLREAGRGHATVTPALRAGLGACRCRRPLPPPPPLGSAASGRAPPTQPPF